MCPEYRRNVARRGRAQGRDYHLIHCSAVRQGRARATRHGRVRAGKIIVIDSHHICRFVDGEVRTLPRESAPASLQNWARRLLL